MQSVGVAYYCYTVTKIVDMKVLTCQRVHNMIYVA